MQVIHFLENLEKTLTKISIKEFQRLVSNKTSLNKCYGPLPADVPLAMEGSISLQDASDTVTGKTTGLLNFPKEQSLSHKPTDITAK